MGFAFRLGLGLTPVKSGGDPALISLALAPGVTTDAPSGTVIGTLSFTAGPKRPTSIALDLVSGITTDAAPGTVAGMLRAA